MELRAPVVSQDVALLGSVQIGMKAFVQRILGHPLNQNKMCKAGKDKHTKQHCESSTWKLAGQGTAAPKLIHALYDWPFWKLWSNVGSALQCS